jgi:RimJ/RimL family protein N-acetyltransferase
LRHDLRIEGEAYRLRPVTIEDAAFIVELRTDPRLGRFINDTSPRIEDQVTWIERYLTRENDYYFIVERRGTGRPEGTISVYDVDTVRNEAEWGRWVIHPKSLGATESVLLILRAAFDTLGLSAVHSRTMADNGPVVSLHDSFGAPRHRVLPAYAVIKGIPHDAVEHRIDRAAVKPRFPP